MIEDSVKPAWIRRLDAGLAALDLSVRANVSKQLLQFIVLLYKWNRTYNLTAVRDPLDMIDRHLLDSLSILPHLQAGRILDFGSGAGLPGIPLAVMRPDSRFVLLDSNNKKIRFIRQAKLELGLDNVIPVHARVESYQAEEPFDVLIARAFTSLPRMLALTESVRDENTLLMAMKGGIPQDEIKQVCAEFRLEIIPLQVPFTQAARHLIVISRQT